MLVSARLHIGIMKLYKYRNLSNAWATIDIIVNRRLYLAPLNSLNDPMELKTRQSEAVLDSIFSEAPAYYQPPSKLDVDIARSFGLSGFTTEIGSARDIISAMHASNYSKICSLSTTPHSVPMWSHYAGGHQGVCFEFDLSVGSHPRHPFSRGPKPVRYLDSDRYEKEFSREYAMRTLNRLSSRENSATIRAAYMLAKLHRLYTVKIRDWSYEDEWRILGNATQSYYHLADDEHLSRIFLGSRIQRLHCEIIRKLVPSNVSIVQTFIDGGLVKEI